MNLVLPEDALRLSSHALRLLAGIQTLRRGWGFAPFRAADNELAAATGLSVHQVRRAFPELDAAGYVKRSSRGPNRLLLIRDSLTPQVKGG